MLKKINILITGANGFIGSHILKKLSENDEFRVCGLVRKTSNLFRLEEVSYELFYNSINDPLEKTLKGFEVVIHTAGMARD